MDYGAVKANLSIVDVAHGMGLTLKQEGTQYRSKCPACGTENERAIVITPDKGIFCCFAAPKRANGKHLGGDIIELVSHIRGVTRAVAFNELAPPATVASQKKEQKAFDPSEYAKTLVTDHDLIKATGLTKEECERFRLGVSPKGIHAGRITLPLTDKSGDVVFVSVSDIKLPNKWR